MAILSSEIMDTITVDLDVREEVIRNAVYNALSQMARPDLSDSITASYFIWSNSITIDQAGREICYHMTSGIRHPEKGSLLDQCTGRVIDSTAFDRQQRYGVVRITYPLKMLHNGSGNLYSTDILHIVGGAGVFALRENRDAKLVDVAMSDETLAKFPGPAYGAEGLRKLTDFGDEIAFGTILKPCTGITAEQEAQIVYQAAADPLFMFIKEDENFLPGVNFAPVSARAKHALEAVRRAMANRAGRGVIFAPHITSPPHLIIETLKRVLDVGVNGVMFSEYYCEGAVRMVREFTRNLAQPPAIYGHNGGITTRTRHIYREVLDMFARLDGVDIRQTAPLTQGIGLLRPFGLEWRKCEEILTKPMAGKPAVMIARAGGLDQGNIIRNLLDIGKCGSVKNYLFLAGSAINNIKNSRGHYDPAIGAKAMRQALHVFKDNVFENAESVTAQSLKSYAKANGLEELAVALTQRYEL
ncbi:MAG: RuBisCO large subunit C-terminal-like domain-containing protein [Planctomycetota bacterium]